MPLHVLLFGVHPGAHYRSIGVKTALAALITGSWIILVSPESRQTTALYGVLVVTFIPLLAMLGSPDRRIKAATLSVFAGEAWGFLTQNVIVGLITVMISYLIWRILQTVLPQAHVKQTDGAAPRRATVVSIVAGLTAAWVTVAGPTMLIAYRYLTQRETSPELAVLTLGGGFAVVFLFSIFSARKQRRQRGAR